MIKNQKLKKEIISFNRKKSLFKYKYLLKCIIQKFLIFLNITEIKYFQYNCVKDITFCYINLQESDARNKHMINEFKRKNITNYNRYCAVSINNYMDYIGNYHLSKLSIQTPGIQKLKEYMCFLSHIQLWENIVKNNMSHLFILEDDIVFNNDFDINLSEVLKNIPINADFIFVNGIKKNSFQIKLTKNLSFTSSYGGTYGYIITYSGAIKALNHLYEKGMYLPVDIQLKVMAWRGIICAYKSNLCLIDHLGLFKSTIRREQAGFI